MNDLIDRQAVIDALHTWFRDGFDEDKWWNSTHVLAAIEGLPSAQQGYKWETCFDCPLSHGCPKIKGCTNEQANEYASQIPNDCPLSTQPNHVADVSKKVSISCAQENDLISRKAAIEALARMMPRSYTPDGSHPGDEEIFRAQEVFADCIEALEILPSAQPEQRWIPCRKKLPEKVGAYLVQALMNGDIFVARWEGCYWGVKTPIVAWMELPEPYCPNCGADMRKENES